MEQGEERGGEERAYQVEGRSGLGKSRALRDLEGLTELSFKLRASREGRNPVSLYVSALQ